MKTFFFSIAVSLLWTVLHAQEPFGRPNLNNCEKKAQKEFFKLKKDGWMIETDGSTDMKSELTKFFLLQEDVDTKKNPNYFFADGSVVADTKEGGFLASTAKAKIALAQKLVEILDTALSSKLNTKHATEIEKAEAHKMIIDLKDVIAKKIFKANVLLKLYRTSETNSMVPDNQIETMVRIYHERKFLFELGSSETAKIFKNKYDLGDEELNGLLKH